MAKTSSLKRRQAYWAYAFLAIPMIFFLWIRIYPVLSSFHISLLEWDIFSANKPFVGLKNFERMLSDKTLHKALINTFKYIIICMPIGLGLSLVRQIAERHGGQVRCEAREGGGSLFVLRLPGWSPAR